MASLSMRAVRKFRRMSVFGHEGVYASIVSSAARLFGFVRTRLLRAAVKRAREPMAYRGGADARRSVRGSLANIARFFTPGLVTPLV